MNSIKNYVVIILKKVSNYFEIEKKMFNYLFY